MKQAHTIVQNKDKGYSVENLYALLPIELQGKVEFTYDLNHNPSIHFFEELLYRTFYSPDHQEISLFDSSDDLKRFILSTPVLSQNNKLNLRIPFSDTRLNILFKARYEAHDIHYLSDLFNILHNKQSLFKSLFTTQAPQQLDNNYCGSGVRVRYLGHACLLIETSDVSILINLAVSDTLNNDIERYNLDDLPGKIDYAY